MKAKTEPEVKEYDYQWIKYRVIGYLIILALLLAVIVLTAYTANLSAIEARKLYEESEEALKAIVERSRTLEELVLNLTLQYAAIALFGYLPLIGFFFITYITYQAGVKLAAYAIVQGVDRLAFILYSLSDVSSLLELAAFSLVATESLFVGRAVLKGRSTRRLELPFSLMVLVLSLSLLALASCIEASLLMP